MSDDVALLSSLPDGVPEQNGLRGARAVFVLVRSSLGTYGTVHTVCTDSRSTVGYKYKYRSTDVSIRVKKERSRARREVWRVFPQLFVDLRPLRLTMLQVATQ
jgi:hypothetical protein